MHFSVIIHVGITVGIGIGDKNAGPRAWHWARQDSRNDGNIALLFVKGY
jgi:hypothetical protein